MHALPPVGIAALAFAVGVATADPGAIFRAAPLLLAAALTAPISTSRRLTAPWLLAACVVAGAAAGRGSPDPAGCPGVGGSLLRGRPLVDASPQAAVPVRLPDGGCEVRVSLRRGRVPAAADATFFGGWRRGARTVWFVADSARLVHESRGASAGLRWRLVVWRAALARRLERLFPERAPLVRALVLARREGLDPQLREAFARMGIAHLLAISGFHVGVVGGMLLALAGLARAGPRTRRAVAAGGVAVYVALLGFPAAASRAALILLLATAAGLRRRPTDRWGPLTLAFLVLLAWRPRELFQPGFQLSFAGAAGLTLWAPPLRRRLAGWERCAVARWPALALVPSIAAPVAAGVAATAATLPVVAWHFQRVSLVGVPATLLAAPLVALAVPGVLLSLAADVVLPPLGAFLAGGTDWVLAALETGARRAAGWPLLAAAVDPAALLRLSTAFVAAHLLLLWRAPTAYRAATRRGLAAVAACGCLVAWPLVQGLAGRGELRVVFLDVGQGDAMALRTPAGRWMLVDAGPEGRGDAPPAALRHIRRLGVLGLERLVLTHPDLDHVGGAARLLRSVPVGRVVDPGVPAPSEAYIDALEWARARGVPWVEAKRGGHWTVDGVSVRVLAPSLPSGASPASAADTPTNDASVVLHVHWRGFDALLMGDAPAAVEREVLALLPDTGRIEVLKVGHHGSVTSSDSVFLSRVRPRLAVVSVGRRNRYGHPAPSVLRRLIRSSHRVVRTDRDGTVEVRVRPDGAMSVRSDAPHGR